MEFKDIIRKKIKSIFIILTLLLIGLLIYVLFRAPLSWLAVLNSTNQAIIDLSWLPTPLATFILNHLTGVVWALALAETVYVIKDNYLLGTFIAFASTVLFESMQYFNFIPGTGDIWDVIFVTISLIGYLLIKKRGRNEKKT